jgi:hypothetical protein
MEKLTQYYEVMNEGQQFLDNHNQLLQSLLLSRHNAGNNSPNPQPEGIGNGPDRIK